MKASMILMCAVVVSSSAVASTDSFDAAWHGIRAEDLARHIATLASDEFEGREPGTPGEAKTVAYLEQAFRDVGAAPGFEGGYLQRVPLVELKRDGTPSWSVTGGRKVERYAFETDFVAFASRPTPSVRLTGLPIVFAGYGATAPEYGWDDYAGVDVAGAAVVLLRGEPSNDSTLFGGRALTMHGLSLTKNENAARRGARAAIVVHTDASAGYPWSVMTGGGIGGAQNFLEDAGNSPKLELVVHVNQPAARRMFAAMGLDLDTLMARASRPGFVATRTPCTTDVKYSATLRRIESHNVVAKIEGGEAADECVIYTGHWDHVGRNNSLKGDQIFNGAVDNATGTAAVLEIAQAFAAMPRPRRTVYFVATTAEEKGLLGSEYLASHPIVPLAKTVAVLNLDALFPFGAFNAMTVTGLGSSELEDELAAAAARIGRTLQDDGSPEAGAYYRSDHYPFAKRGVPALFAVGNPRAEDATDDSPVGKRFADYMVNGYHKVGDEYDAATWDLAGVEGDARVYFETGWRVAQTRRFPNWRYGNEFRTARDSMRTR